jgi:hypothetical protein
MTLELPTKSSREETSEGVLTKADFSGSQQTSQRFYADLLLRVIACARDRLCFGSADVIGSCRNTML